MVPGLRGNPLLVHELGVDLSCGNRRQLRWRSSVSRLFVETGRPCIRNTKCCSKSCRAVGRLTFLPQIKHAVMRIPAAAPAASLQAPSVGPSVPRRSLLLCKERVMNSPRPLAVWSTPSPNPFPTPAPPRSPPSRGTCWAGCWSEFHARGGLSGYQGTPAS